MIANSLINLVVHFVTGLILLPGIRPWPRPSREGFCEVFAFASFSFVNKIIGKLTLHIDKIVLARVSGTVEVSLLSVPDMLLKRIAGISVASGNALFPRFSSIKEGREMQDLYINSTWCLLCLTLTIFIPTTLLLPEFLRLWMGEAFAEKSAPVAQVMAASYALRGVSIPYFALLKGTGRAHWLTFLYVFSSGLGILACVLLVSHFGLMGAGYRMWVMLVFIFVVVLFVCKKLFPDLSQRSIVGLLAVPILIAVVLSAAFWYVLNEIPPYGWIALIVAWSTMALLLAVALWSTNRLQTGATGAAAQLHGSVSRSGNNFMNKVMGKGLGQSHSERKKMGE